MIDDYLPHDHEDDNSTLFQEEHEADMVEERLAVRKSAAVDEIPQPVYRLKMLHSSETFHAYYVPPSVIPRFMPQCVLEAALEGPRAESPQAAASPPEGQVQKTCEHIEAMYAAQDAESGQSASTPGMTEFVIPPRSLVIAPTKYGRDLVIVLGVVRDLSVVNADELVLIERPATVDDYRRYLENLEHEKEAFERCRERIEAHNLPMKLVSAHTLLEDSKLLFYFTAESRVDFRDLVRDLVGIFHTRIELRQIGVRDEARVTGGCGVCGRVLCCHGLSDKLNPVSIKMAKDQNLSLNSLKISGPCGRLLCCLSYEHQFYRDARRELPNEGTRFVWDGTQFKVIEVNVLSNRVRLAGEDGRILDMNAGRLKYSEGHWTVMEET